MIEKRYFKTQQNGMTLIELAVAMLILVAMAGLAMPYLRGASNTAMCQATDATMQEVKQAIMGGAAGVGYYGDMLGQLPRDRAIATGYSLHYLFIRDDGLDNDGDSNPPSTDGRTNIDPDDEWQAYNARTSVGWRGPYLRSGATNPFPVDGSAADIAEGGANELTDELHTSFDDATRVHVAVASDDRVVLDGWGRPIILQVPATCSYSNRPGGCARLVSAGPIPGRDIQTNGIDVTISDEDAEPRGDDRVLFLQIPDPRRGGNRPCQ